MIQAIISPAKQMDVGRDAFGPRGIPPFPHKSERVLRALHDIEAEQGAGGLKSLWAVSDRLLDENIARLHEFEHVASPEQLLDARLARKVGPAVFSYIGIQFRSMAPEVMDADALEWLQGHLWILSALYGCVRPFDAVQPYRLEMGAKLAIGPARNLYDFWGESISSAVRPDPETDLVNLASTEYAKAVLPHLDEHAAVATCVFSSSLRNGKPLQKSTESKTARGSMVRWMAERRPERLEDLERFDVGFRFAPELSSTRGARRTLVFMKA